MAISACIFVPIVLNRVSLSLIIIFDVATSIPHQLIEEGGIFFPPTFFADPKGDILSRNFSRTLAIPINVPFVICE
jgi:hypothetical protein